MAARRRAGGAGVKIKPLLRRIRAKITGKRPCTFDTVHGHKLEFLYGVGEGIGRHLIFECPHCREKFSYSPIFGLEAE